jgi:hypothetical protein
MVLEADIKWSLFFKNKDIIIISNNTTYHLEIVTIYSFVLLFFSH